MMKFTFRWLLSLLVITSFALSSSAQYLSEDFEGGALPTGWSLEYVSGTHDWVYQSGDGGTSPAHGGTMSAAFEHTSTGSATKLNTLDIDLSGATSPQLNFWHVQKNWGGDQDQLRVFYRISALDPWVLLQEWTSDIASWQEETIDLPNPSATYAIAFEATDGYGYGVAIDDVFVQETPSCLDPMAQDVINVTSTEATLIWMAGATETDWEVEYGVTGFVQGAGTTVAVTDTFANISSLNAETSYEFYVRSVCGAGDESAWVGAYSFYTGYCLPASSSSSTYIDDFSTTNGSANISNLGSGYTAGGYFNGSTQFVESFETGTFDFSASIVGGTAGFSMWVDWNNDLILDNATEKVFNTTGYGSGPFTGTITIPSGTPQGDYRMRITTDWNSSNPTDPCADDRSRAEFEDYTITVSAAPSCLAPSGLTASNITAADATLSWMANGTETDWEVEYGASGFTQGAGTTVTVTDTFANISLLMADTGYEFYVRAVCGAGDESDWAGAYAFQTMVSCPAPTGLTSSMHTANSATVSWNAGAMETDWEVEYGEAGFIQGAGTTVAVTDTFANISSLMAETDYEFYVRAVCGAGDESTWVGANSFTTLCDVVSAFPHLEDFTTFVPNCWNEATSGDLTTGPTGLGSGAWGSTSSFPGGNNAARINLYNTSHGDWTLSPQFDLSATDYQVELDVAVAAYSGGGVIDMGSDDSVVLLISEDGTTWNTLKTWTVADALTNSANHFTVDLTAYSSTASFAIWGSDGSVDDSEDYYFYFDNFLVREIPSCLEPTAQTVTDITETTATLSWIAGDMETDWNVEYGVAGFVQGTAVMAVTDTFIQVNSLMPSTGYEFYVQSDCGGVQSTWVGPFSFMTECGTIMAPFTQDFENAGSIPLCWLQGAANVEDWKFSNDISSPGHVGNDDDANGTTSASAGYFAWVDDSTPDNVGTTIESPMIDLSALTTPMLQFYLLSNNEGNSNVEFQVDIYDGSTWTGVYTNQANTNDWEEISVDLSAFSGTIQLRFVVNEPANGDFYDDVAIDDISVIEAPTCWDPTALSVSGQTDTQVDLAWTATSGETTFDIEYGEAPYTFTGIPTIEDIANPYTLGSLTASTNYVFYVRADCGTGDESAWVGPFAFSTTASCPDPADLSAIAYDVTAELSWNGFFATNFDIEWDVTGFTPTGTPTINDNAGDSYTLGGLTENVSYDYYVRADCASDDTDVSNWVGPFTFTTVIPGEACSLPLDYGNINDVAINGHVNVGVYNWYTVTLDQVYADVTFSLCGSPFDTRLWVFDACDGTQIGYDDDGCIAPTSTASVINFSSLDAGTYYVRMDEYGQNAAGDYVLEITGMIPSLDTDILTFSHATETAPATIDAAAHTVDLEVLFATDITGFVADFTLSNGANAQIATVDQTSGTTSNDFSSGALVYDITAQDGVAMQAWTVNVTNAAASTEKDILTYTLADQTGAATIVGQDIDITVGAGTDPLGLVATFTISDMASINIAGTDQVSATTPNDFVFGTPMTYTVVAEDGSTLDWLVTVNEAVINDETDILTFSFPNETGPATIDASAHTINVEVAACTDLSMLIADFTLSFGANADISTVAQVSGTTVNDFTNPVTYTVTAENTTSTQDWTITVTQPSGLVNVYPFFESFEDTDMPNCWTVLDVDADGGEFGINTTEAFDGSQSTAVNYNSNGNDDWLISPQFEITQTDLALGFAAKSRSTYLESYNVLISTSGNAPADFTVVLENVVDAPNTWVEKMYNLADYGINNGDQIYVAIQCISVDKWTLYIDAFSISTPMSADAEITSYILPGQDDSSIEAANDSISITMPFGSQFPFTLAAEFALSANAAAAVATVPQVSTTTDNTWVDVMTPVVYDVTAEDGTIRSWSVYIGIADGVNNVIDSKNITVYPNPNTGEFNIAFNLNDVKTVNIEVLNVQGQVIRIFDRIDSDKTQTIDLSEQSEGMYFVRISSENETVIKKVNIIK